MYFMTKLIIFISTLFLSKQIHASESIPHIDPELIPKIEEKTAILNSPEYRDVLINQIDIRPQKCPLRSDMKLLGILEQLETISVALKYGECYDKNREIIDEFETLLSDETQIYASIFSDNQSTGQANSSQQERQALVRRQQLFEVLKTVTGDDACLYNIRKRGLLPVVADVLTNIGRVSSLIPTMHSIYFSVGAISLGATLKIIASIFSSDFDWNDASERRQFLRLNCNFFDLRRELEAADVIQTHDKNIPQKIERSQQVRFELSDYFNILKIQKETAQNQIKDTKEAYLQSVLPSNTLEISKSIESLQLVVPAIDITSPEEKLIILQEYTNQLTKLSSYIEEYYYDPPYKDYLMSLLKTMTWDKLPENISAKNESLLQNTLEPINYYLNLYEQQLSNLIEEKNQKFLTSKNQEDELSNSEVIEQVEENYKKIFFEFLKTISFIDARIELLRAKDTKHNLDAFDEGAQNTYDILESYDFIKSVLIGKLGYSCLNYFREKLSRGLSDFDKSFHKFKEKYFKNIPDDGIYKDLWPCRDANSLRVLWENVNSAGEVANDFIQTNTAIFQSDVRKVSTVLSILPVRISREKQLLQYVKTAECATSMLNGEIPISKKKLRKIQIIEDRNLGLLLLKRKEFESNRAKIEHFWNNRNCGSIL